MTGHAFEVRDSVNGAPSAYPSVQLCRTDYDPNAGWDGAWVSAAEASGTARWDFAAASSATQQAILDWNNENPRDVRPVCGTFAEATSGPQQGQWRSEGLGEGAYWLVETKAPDSQLSPTGLESRAVSGVQRLAAAIPFQVWPDAAGPAAGESMQGHGQLEIGHQSSAYEDRCEPSSPVADRPTACINEGGLFMVVKDPVPTPMPMTGGLWLPVLTGIGALVLAAALSAAAWRRRNLALQPGA
ncbi:hypothetical protein [Leucobacter komagatae]|nr:hypothetical protein [Leucobacter komagatae]